ncbi:MAG: hypothetical protein GY856_10195 [bacterium]|nr:hypothetical protein [bacterium]
MRKENLICTIVLLGLSSFAMDASGQEAQRCAAEAICAWVADEEAPSMAAVESLSGPQRKNCRRAWSCLGRVKAQPAERVVGDESALDPEALCARVPAAAAADDDDEIRRLAAAVTGDCLSFIECWLEAGAETAGAEQETAWKEDFERICSQTATATSLAPEKLRELIGEAGDLLQRLENLQVPAAKVYRFRLEKCKGFFEYALKFRETSGDANEGG